MKFTDGFWRAREGVEIFNAARVYDIEMEENAIRAYAPYFDVQNRGQTLQGPLLSYRFSSPMPEVVRVQIWHFKGDARKGPFFDIDEDVAFKPELGQDDEAAWLRSGRLSLRIAKGPAWSLDFMDGDRELTNSRWKNSGYVRVRGGVAQDCMPKGTETLGDGVYLKEQLALGVGECVYGLGERFTPFVKNGQRVDSWNADGGTSSELSYKAVPFYLSNRGYGVFVNDPGLVSFEVASEKVSRVQFSARGEYLEYFVINGPDPKGVLERLCALTGRPALPPAWSFGLWLTTSFITEYDEKTVTGFIEGMASRKLPLSVFHFDCFWMREYHWTDFAWNERYFPDPRGFLRRLKERGLRICVWINPYIAQRSRLFEEGARAGFLLKKPDGGVWQVDTWQPGMGMVDFTHPGARDWFCSKLDELMDIGVDSFKTDFGERIPLDVSWSDGSDPERMHNYYSHLYNKTVFEAMEKRLGRGRAMVFARSGTAGTQKYPIHWGGDCTANYESMAESLRGGLSLCLSGYSFWSHDISGFESTATPDLYKRWTAFGLLSSHSRLHGNASYRVPWLFDEEAVDVLRYFTRLKCRLMPYLYSMAVQASGRGLPMMRAMVLEYPDDPACAQLDRQYMLGDSILVAPVFSPEGTVEYYLPEGLWTSLIDGRAIRGGRWIREKHGYMSLPLLAREGAMIASGACEDRPDYDYPQDALVTIYSPPDGWTSSICVPLMDGEPGLSLEARRVGDRIFLEAGGSEKPWRLAVSGLEIGGAAGMRLSSEGDRALLVPEKAAGSYEIALGRSRP